MGINLHVNIFGTSNKLDSLQDNRLKNDHPLRISFPSSYAVKILCKGWDKQFTNKSRWYVVALGWQSDKFSPPIFPLTILLDSSIQVSTGILVHQILVETEERIVGSIDVKPGEADRAC